MSQKIQNPLTLLITLYENVDEFESEDSWKNLLSKVGQEVVSRLCELPLDQQPDFSLLQDYFKNRHY